MKLFYSVKSTTLDFPFLLVLFSLVVHTNAFLQGTITFILTKFKFHFPPTSFI